ncbi:EamA family transporter [Halobellus ruber]|uniref:DMT family transporter n=1 Tax=Halobellus ruber TaxID=2761102 RepID=A0A7J9SLW4_9EURY|nr:EamA family transporter [Halobellus ruber]MBB6646011.1 DMT family transporter [Halobellus ruber]
MSAALSVLSLSLVSGLCWGIGPIFSKLGMEHGGRSERATLVVLSVGATIFWVVSLGSRVGLGGGGNLPLVALSAFVVSGLCGTSLAWLLWFRGIDRVGASVSNVVFYSQPLFAVLLAALLLGERVTATVAVGVALIVGGITLLSLSGDRAVGSWNLSSLLFPLGAAVLAAGGTVLNRFGFSISAVTPLEAATVNLTSALPLMVGYALVRQRSVFTGVGRSDLYFVGSGLANAAALFTMFAALETGSVVLVAPIVGTSPLFTTLFASMMIPDVERVTRRTVVSAALTVAGVAAISFV